MATDAVESRRDQTADGRPAVMLAVVMLAVPIVVTLVAQPTLLPLVGLADAVVASLGFVAWQKRRVHP